MSMELLVAALPAATTGGPPQGVAGASPGNAIDKTDSAGESGEAGFSLLLQLLLGTQAGIMPSGGSGAGGQTGAGGNTAGTGLLCTVETTAIVTDTGMAAPLLTVTSQAEGGGQPMDALAALAAQAGNGLNAAALADGQGMAQASEAAAQAAALADSGQSPVSEQTAQSVSAADAGKGTVQARETAGEANRSPAAAQEQGSTGSRAAAGEQTQSHGGGSTASDDLAQLLSRGGMSSDEGGQSLQPAATRSPFESVMSETAARATQAGRTAGTPAAPEAPQVTQIARDISAQLLRGNTEMRIALKPEHLGEMRVKVVLDADSVSMSVRVESAPVKTMLEASAVQLRDALMQHGIKVGSFDVNVQDQGVMQQEQRFDGFFRQAHDSGSAYGFDETGAPSSNSAEDALSGPVATGPRGGSSVDYLA